MTCWLCLLRYFFVKPLKAAAIPGKKCPIQLADPICARFGVSHCWNIPPLTVAQPAVSSQTTWQLTSRLVYIVHYREIQYFTLHYGFISNMSYIPYFSIWRILLIWPVNPFSSRRKIPVLRSTITRLQGFVKRSTGICQLELKGFAGRMTSICQLEVIELAGWIG